MFALGCSWLSRRDFEIDDAGLALRLKAVGTWRTRTMERKMKVADMRCDVCGIGDRRAYVETGGRVAVVTDVPVSECPAQGRPGSPRRSPCASRCC